ncbi:MAG TPA: GNAT family N-acetyltransferase [Terriglobia bacterium]|nr:GNAT family N-acetyltransferase [Terriglobia bacterium]
MSTLSQTGVHIRPAETGDLETLGAWAAELLRQWDADATREDAIRVYQRILSSPEMGVIFVAEHNGVMSGFVYAAYQWRAEFAGETLDMVEMFVEQSWRNKGVGRALLDALAAHARARQIHRITCQVHPGNAAIERALESGGFDPERRTLWGVRL